MTMYKVEKYFATHWLARWVVALLCVVIFWVAYELAADARRGAFFNLGDNVYEVND